MGKQSKQTIAAVLAVKNEEEILQESLEHIKDWVDEIIIIDNGSTDKTAEIAKRFTKKIYSVKEKLLIPELQQKGIEKATTDWIIVLDADVFVPEAAAKEIQQKIQDANCDGYYLIHKNYFLGKPLKCHFKQHSILKLFRRGQARFEGKAAHEAVTFTGNGPRTIKNYLIHNTHPSIATFMRKANLYSSQDAQKLAQGKSAGIRHRKLKNAGVYKILCEPILYFFHFLIIRKAFLDGIRGIILAGLFSMYLFLENAKVYEITLKRVKKEQTT